MHACMHVCMYVYIYIYIYIYIHTHTHRLAGAGLAKQTVMSAAGTETLSISDDAVILTSNALGKTVSEFVGQFIYACVYVCMYQR